MTEETTAPEPERVFKTDAATVGEMLEAGVSLSDFIDTSKYPVQMDWGLLIKICNAGLLSGPRFDENSTVGELIRALPVVLKRTFL